MILLDRSITSETHRKLSAYMCCNPKVEPQISHTLYVKLQNFSRKLLFFPQMYHTTPLPLIRSSPFVSSYQYSLRHSFPTSVLNIEHATVLTTVLFWARSLHGKDNLTTNATNVNRARRVYYLLRRYHWELGSVWMHKRIFCSL